MTLSKTAQADKRINDSSKRLQDATDSAYNSLIALFLVAEEHLNTCEAVAAEQGWTVESDGLRRVSNSAQWWQGHMHCENVIHHVRQMHRIIGHSAWSRVELPLPDRRIPPPTGADRFIL